MQRVYATFQLVGTADLAACALSAGSVRAFGQTEPLMLTGQVSVAGRETPYRIRSLPVSSFPDLPRYRRDAAGAGMRDPADLRSEAP